MKAEFIKFNSIWIKNCSKCGAHYNAETKEGLGQFFTKDKNKPDGLDYSCKKCKKDYRKKNKDKETRRWKAYYAPGTENRKRHVVRSQTRRKYGTAKTQNCDMCNEKADEWHHIEYVTDKVVPLCHKCHEKIT